jgi:hypothetical protein
MDFRIVKTTPFLAKGQFIPLLEKEGSFKKLEELIYVN